MAAKFEWKKTVGRIRESARNMDRAVGYALHVRRLHLGLTQTQVARRVSKRLGKPHHVEQPQIDQVEDGKLPGTLRGRKGEAARRALLQVLKWQSSDMDFMDAMIVGVGRRL